MPDKSKGIQRRPGGGVGNATVGKHPEHAEQVRACRVTAGSRFPGFGRVLRVTGGQEGGPICIHEDDTGVCRTPEDTSPPRFGTVRLPLPV
jgi:hypothetical protein